jgi:hypothetical protein
MIEMKTIAYRDIPKLTSIGAYQINVNLESLNRTMEDFLENKLDLNPDFQRGRVWSVKQSQLFVEFLLKGGKTNNIIYFNQPGWGYDWEGEFVIVDGLQRLNACWDFMNNKLKVFGGYYYKNFEYLTPVSKFKIRGNVDLIFNVNNLKTRKEVLNWYLEMNSGHMAHTKRQIDKVKELLKKEGEF